ncbi:MAG: response regulator transcription factor [Actinomycetota bacterium]
MLLGHQLRDVRYLDLARLPTWWSVWPADDGRGLDLVCWLPTRTVAEAIARAREDLALEFTLEDLVDELVPGGGLVIRARPGGEIRSLTFYHWGLMAKRRGLTRREAEVVQGIAEGRGYSRIAGRLGLSEHTVRSYALAAMAKLRPEIVEETDDTMRTMLTRWWHERPEDLKKESDTRIDPS